MIVDFAEKSLISKARSRPDLARQAIDKARREGPLSTLEMVLSRLDQRMPLGYSSSGTIIATGENLPHHHIGARVACAGGGYAVHAEYAIIPDKLLTPLPDSVDFESAAFATLGAIALHGFRLGQPGIGERVAVIGLGLVGLLAVGIANAAGCRVFGVDLDPIRVNFARKMGAELAILREEAESAAQSFTQGDGFDVILVCADSPSADPVRLAGTIARDRAKVVAIGAVELELPRKVYYEKELAFINSRSYGPGRYDPAYEERGQDYPIGYVRWTEGRNLRAFIDLLAAQRINVQPLITHRYPIERAPEAYDLITGKTNEQYLGVLISYASEPGIPQSLATKIETRASSTRTARSSPQPGKQLCRLGVLGAGEYARTVLLPALRKIDQVELVGIATPGGLNAAQAARRFGFRYASSDENQILSDTEINAIAVLTRHNLHASLTLTGLKSGKHVFCEKPIAIDEKQLLEIEVFLNEQMPGQRRRDNRGDTPIIEKTAPLPAPLLMVGFNRRFSEFSLRLKDFLSNRQEPLVIHYRVNAGYLPPTHWLHDPGQGGGRIIGECCHFIDFLTFLVGSIPNSVTAHALPDSGRYLQDNVLLTFTFPDGSLGSIEYLANGDKVFPKERIEAFSEGKVGMIDDFRTLETVERGRRKVTRSWLRQDKGHQAECSAFVNAVLHRLEPPIPYEHIIGVARATFASVQALTRRESISIHSPTG
jgi:predicted dehydrogenase/threonine dehydrogenase-like Zn-dependent dehydrogenase